VLGDVEETIYVVEDDENDQETIRVRPLDSTINIAVANQSLPSDD
jgi:hypothetical protein